MYTKKKGFLKLGFNTANLVYGDVTPDDNEKRRLVETVVLSAFNTTSNTAAPTVFFRLDPITGSTDPIMYIAKFKVTLGTDIQVHNINLVVPENYKFRVVCSSAGDYLAVNATYVEMPHQTLGE